MILQSVPCPSKFLFRKKRNRQVIDIFLLTGAASRPTKAKVSNVAPYKMSAMKNRAATEKDKIQPALPPEPPSRPPISKYVPYKTAPIRRTAPEPVQPTAGTVGADDDSSSSSSDGSSDSSSSSSSSGTAVGNSLSPLCVICECVPPEGGRVRSVSVMP